MYISKLYTWPKWRQNYSLNRDFGDMYSQEEYRAWQTVAKSLGNDESKIVTSCYYKDKTRTDYYYEVGSFREERLDWYGHHLAPLYWARPDPPEQWKWRLLPDD